MQTHNWKCLVVVAMFVAFLVSAAAAQNTCIGYLKAGDITVRCGNVVTRVTHRGDARQFAVSEDGATLVLETERAGQRQFEVVSLNSHKVTKHPWRANGGLSSSCGTVVLHESRDGGYQMRDLTSDRVFAIDPYTDFACSSDRATVAGLVGSSPVALKIGIPPRTQVATAPKPNLIQFSLSPYGTQITYTTVEMKLCVAAGAAVPTCTSVSQYPVDGLSIRDDGTVLYSISDDGCVYTDRVRAAHKDCDEMYRWKPGLPAPVLEGIGGDPQWLSAGQAAALIAYSHGTKR